MDWLSIVHGKTSSLTWTFGPGDEVRVWFRILEQGKERLGQFEGLVIRIRGAGLAKTFTVRRVTYGEGVERVFPLDSKMITKIEVLRRGKVRRSKLYYLRTKIGKTRIAAADEPGRPKTPERSTGAVENPADVDPGTEQAEGSASTATQPADSTASPT